MPALVFTGGRDHARTGVIRVTDHYAPVYLSPDGSALVGVLGGIVKVRDGS